MTAKKILEVYGTAFACAALFLLFAVAAENFISVVNLLNVLKQISYLTIIAIGFTLALITGELDLSFASAGSLASVVTAALLFGGYPLLLGVLCGAAVGAAIGIANGLLVTRLKIPSLITTLATATIANGLAFLITGGVAFVGKMHPGFLFLGRGVLFGIPVLIIWMAAIVLLAQFLVKQTRLGIHMVCTGESEEAARLAGIRTKRMKVLGLAFSGLAAGVTGILLTASLSSSSPTIAGDFLMSGIAAVLLGMTTFEPGRPNVPGTVVGALIIGLLTNGLTLIGAQYYIQDIVLGLIIIFSVSVSATQMKQAAFGAPR